MEDADTRLDTFNPYVKRYILNVDKSWSPQEIKRAVFNNCEHDIYVNVCVLMQRCGESAETAVIDMPRTYLRYIKDLNSIEVRGKIKNIQVAEDMKGKRHAWKMTDRGSTVTDTKAIVEDGKREIDLLHCLVDAGAFLTQEAFNKKKDVHHVISRAYLSGVEKIVVRSKNIRQAEQARKLADLYPNIVYFTAGVHPEGLAKGKFNMEENMSTLEKLMQDPHCVAVGEIGFDVRHPNLSVDAQLPMFRKQVELACKYGKPLVIYENEAMTSVLEVLKEFKNSLTHVCVTSTQLFTTADIYLEKGFYVVMSGRHFNMKDIKSAKTWLQRKADNILSGQLKLMFASEAPDFFPVPLIESKQAYFKAMKLDISIDEEVRKMVQCYTVNRNEPLGVQGLAELVSAELVLPPGTIDRLTRKHAYAFFYFSRTKHSEESRSEMEDSPSDSDCVKLNYFVILLPLLGVVLYFLFSWLEPVHLV